MGTITIMFSNFFGSTVVEEDLRQTIIKATSQNERYKVCDLLQRHKLNVNNPYLVDDYGQNLLHLAVRVKGYDLAKFLVEKKIDKLKKNLFHETPFDIALKNHDLKMVETLLNIEYPSNFVLAENKRLTDKVNEIESNNLKLVGSNTALTQKNAILCIQLDDEKRSHKRQRDDHDNTVNENKKLRNENNLLKEDNKTLTNTIKTLRESMKK